MFRSSREDNKRKAQRIKAQIADRKRREEWEKSEEANKENALAIFLMHSIILAFTLFLIGLTIVLLPTKNSVVSILGVIVVLGPIYITMLKYASPLSVSAYLASIPVITANKKISLILLSLTNTFAFLFFGLRTLIPLYYLLVIYLLLSVAIGAFLRSYKKPNPAFFAAGFGPLLVNLFLVFNYFVSFNPLEEEYRFGYTRQTVYSERGYSISSETQNSTLIVLQDNAYSEFPGIRVFPSLEDMRNHFFIRYTFKTGIFGIRVLSNYTFTYFARSKPALSAPNR